MIYPTDQDLNGKAVWVEVREDGTSCKFLLPPREEEAVTLHRRRSSSRRVWWEIRGGCESSRLRMLLRLRKRGISAILSKEDVR